MLSEISELQDSNNYQIKICQNGKFAITFDTENLKVKILENTDHRSFEFDEKELSFNKSDESEIRKTIAHFKINEDFTIDEFYEPELNFNVKGTPIPPAADSDEFRWSFDISNLRERGERNEPSVAHVSHHRKYFILVAVSRINVNEDMKETGKKYHYARGCLDKMEYNTNKEKYTVVNMHDSRKGTAIYCLKLEKGGTEEHYDLKRNVMPDIYYCGSVSGICKFVDVDKNLDDPDNNEQERFIISNFHGIYNFEYNTNSKNISFNLKEKFDYPNSIRRELNKWHTEADCINRIRSCIYDKYFLVTQYKNDVQSLEIYNLAKMELETTAKEFDYKEEFLRQYNYQNFSVGRLQFCFTRGTDQILLYYREHGLQVAQKRFEIKNIYSLEFFDSDRKLLIICEDLKGKLNFIILDLCHTGKVKTIMSDELYKFSKSDLDDIDTRLARTSGNILHVDNKGNVTSVLKKIENKEKRESEPDRKAKCIECNNEHNNDGSNDSDEVEPWVLDDYKKNSYCLYYSKKGTTTDFLQLIVGRSTVQIWHQIYDDDDKKKDQLPNKGDPFLEYIWTNKIPVSQEREETRLRIEYFNYGSSGGKDGLNGGENGSNDVNDGSNSVNDGSNGVNYGSNYKLNISNFSLKFYWYIRKEEKGVKNKVDKGKDKVDKEKDKIVKENEEIVEFEAENVTNETAKCVEKEIVIITWKNIIEALHPIRHACVALKQLNKRYISQSLVDNYIKVHNYEKMVAYIKHIVWKFAKYNPEQFKWLDARHNFMKNLILGDCDNLIKFILFGDEESIVNENVSNKERKERKKIQNIRHIPRNELWPGESFIEGDDLDFNTKYEDDEKPENNMELAIYHCRGREPKDAIIVAYLLEYYSRHATDYAGWMCTISEAFPLLFKYNYDDYIRRLFRKEFFADYQHHLGFNEIKTECLGRLNNVIKFRATNQPINKLMSDDQDDQDKWSWYEMYIFYIKSIIHMIEFLGKNRKKPPLALRVVPLPNFTKNDISKKKTVYDFKKMVLNLFWIIFIPRWYRIKRGDIHRLSPFSRMVLYENNEDIYNNPAIEAVIDFRWKKAKNFFIYTFIRIFIFAICFVIVSWEYLVHEVISENYRNFLVSLIVMFYYLAIYLLVTEVIQLKYRGLSKYLDLFNFFDICSIVLPVIVMSIMIKEFQFYNGFGNVELADTRLTVGISFSIFFFWIELIFHLRLISRTGIYLYYSLVIFDTILPFFFFMLIMILAFAHSMFILLRDPVNINTKYQTLSGNAINTLTNEALDIRLKSDFDPESRIDNPFSSFSAAIMAAYFWINGNWVQRDEFDFWAVDVFTVIASVVLVIFIQNLLIAYMGGMHERANTEGRQTLLRYRAIYVADYEALSKIHFWQPEDEPKYIYYFGHLKSFEEWHDTKKGNQDAIYKEFEEKSAFTRYNFKVDYDEFSILKYHYDYNDKIEIEKIKDMKSNIANYVEVLIEKFGVTKNDNEIKLINDIKNSTNNNIDRLIEAFE